MTHLTRRSIRLVATASGTTGLALIAAQYSSGTTGSLLIAPLVAGALFTQYLMRPERRNARAA